MRPGALRRATFRARSVETGSEPVRRPRTSTTHTDAGGGSSRPRTAVGMYTPAPIVKQPADRRAIDLRSVAAGSKLLPDRPTLQGWIPTWQLAPKRRTDRRALTASALRETATSFTRRGWPAARLVS